MILFYNNNNINIYYPTRTIIRIWFYTQDNRKHFVVLCLMKLDKRLWNPSVLFVHINLRKFVKVICS